LILNFKKYLFVSENKQKMAASEQPKLLGNFYIESGDEFPWVLKELYIEEARRLLVSAYRLVHGVAGCANDQAELKRMEEQTGILQLQEELIEVLDKHERVLRDISHHQTEQPQYQIPPPIKKSCPSPELQQSDLAILNIVKEFHDNDAGISNEEIMQVVGKQLSSADVSSSLKHLIEEGYIFEAIDENHYLAV
jgi:hypothetical protein